MKPAIELLETRDCLAPMNTILAEMAAIGKVLANPIILNQGIPIGYDVRSLVEYYSHPTETISTPAGNYTTGGSGPITFALGSKTGGLPVVQVFEGNGRTLAFFAFPLAFRGGVNVAMMDVNGDGRSDVIAGAKSGAAIVSVFSGVDGRMLSSWYAGAGNGVNLFAYANQIVTWTDGPSLASWDGWGNLKGGHITGRG